MKKFIAFAFLLCLLKTIFAQEDKSDSLRKVLASSKGNATAIVLNQLAENYLSRSHRLRDKQKDSLLQIALGYATQAEAFSRQLNYPAGIGRALFNRGNIFTGSANVNYATALPGYIAALPLLKETGDTRREAACYMRMADCYHMIGKIEKAVAYYDTSKNIYLRIKDSANYVIGFGMMGHCYHDKGDYKRAYELGSQTLTIAKQKGDTVLTVFALAHLASLFLDADLPQLTVDYMHKIVNFYPHVLDPHDKSPLFFGLRLGLLSAGEAFIKLNEIDSALIISGRIKPDTTDGDTQSFYGNLSKALGKKEEALAYFLRGLGIEQQLNHVLGIARHADELGQAYLELNNFKLATTYAEQSLATAQSIPALLEMRNAVGILNNIYIETKNYEQVYRYSKWYKLLNDSIAPAEYRQKLSLTQIQAELDNQKQHALLLTKDNEIKQQQLSKAGLIRKTFIAGLILLVLIAAIIFFSYRQKQQANILLHAQKKAIENTLGELKATQNQLVHAEKMASLGELTAGIAHEIQNPLNFVNNFSELNAELIEELKGERLKPEAEQNTELENDLINDIAQNSEKINHHGKRADAIVKGMLQHSSTRSGLKEPTDLNALCDEYLRLSYHGLRAKDKNFNVTMKTDFDGSVGMMNITPQDIGKVLMNFYNNAFYATNEKKKLLGAGYEPLVSVTTKKTADKIEIKVTDNGSGIPEHIVDKIFQPFFTTKPTGEGTGLGLSLSYDIVKAYGGEIKVESKAGEESAFIVQLPIV